MASDLIAFTNKLGKIVDGSAMERVMSKAGQAGKKAALDAAAKSLGGDRKMSGMRGGRLSAGYDQVGGSSVQINFRGPWKLAEEGRRGTKRISPKKGRAVRTPQGFRAWSMSRPSRGLHTFSDAVDTAHRTVPKAAHEAWSAEIRRVF